MAVTLLSGIPFSKHLIFYILGLSILRGLLIPDFRYGAVSIVLIQLVFPVALVLPMIFNHHGIYTWKYYYLCVGGIVLATLAALLRYYFDAGKEHIEDSVSTAILLLSFVAQIGALSVLVILWFLIARIRSV